MIENLLFFTAPSNDIELYVKTLSSFHLRAALANLRCSGHNLSIEKGRHANIERSLRICNCCNTGQIEDEYHFISICSSFSDIRLSYIPDMAQNPSYHSFTQLFQSKNVVNLSKYIFAAFKKRKEILKDDIDMLY